MEALTKIGESVEQYVAGKAITVVPAVPRRDWGPEVRLNERLDLDAFLDLANRIANGVLYLDISPFPVDLNDLDAPGLETFLQFEGNIGTVTAAFAINGIAHRWKCRTPWMVEVEKILDEAASPADQRRLPVDPGDRTDDEARDAAASALADMIVAMPEYRAAKFPDRQFGSVAARKQAVEQFLLTRADSLMPTTVEPDEFYARAHALAERSGSSGGLF